MSDTSQGPGWWQASDGKWYPPELYPKDYAPTDEPAADASADTSAEAGSTAAPPVSDMTTVVPPPEGTVPGQPPPAEAPPSAEAPPPAGAPPAQSPGTQPLPVQPPGSEPPPRPGGAPPTAVFEQPSGTEPTATIPAAPPPGWGQPTSVYAEQAPGPALAPAGSNVPAAILALLAAALAIVGSFLEWATATEEGTVVLPPGIANITVPSFDGLDSNGGFTLAFGAIMALVAGLLLAKVRHVLLMVGLIAAGLATAVAFVYSYRDITGLDITINGTKVEGIGFDPGIGLWVALGGGVLSVIAGLLVKRS